MTDRPLTSRNAPSLSQPESDGTDGESDGTDIKTAGQSVASLSSLSRIPNLISGPLPLTGASSTPRIEEATP